MYQFPSVSTLKDVSPGAYVQAEQYLIQLLSKAFPDKSFSVGSTLYWHVVVPAAAAMAAVHANADRIGTSLSLRWIRESPTVDEELAKALLSNYYQRVPDGAYATGYVSIIVNQLSTFSVPEGARFETDSMTYVTTQHIFAVTNDQAVSDSGVDRVLEPRSDGTWSIKVPVRAAEKGVAWSLPPGVSLRMRNPPAGFVEAITATAIAGGEDPVSLKDLLSRVSDSFAPRTYGSDAHLTAIVKSMFPHAHVSVVGMGDRNMQRDRVNPLGISTGGMVDVYVATQSTLASQTIRTTATVISKTTTPFSQAAATLRVTLPPSVCAGVYPASIRVYAPGTRTPIAAQLVILNALEIPSTAYESLGSYTHEVTQDINQTMFAPMTSGSAYQSLIIHATVRPESSYFAYAVNDVVDVDVEMFYMPHIREVHELLTSPAYKSSAVSTMVYGAVPCVVDIHAQIRLIDGDVFTDEEISEAKQRMVQAVARKGFRYGILSSSHIIDILHDYISGRSDVASYSVYLKGQIYGGGQLAMTAQPFVLEGTELSIPDIPEYYISKDTTMFFTDVSRISLSYDTVRT